MPSPRAALAAPPERGYGHFPVSQDMQRRATRHQHVQVRARPQGVGDNRCSGDDVLKLARSNLSAGCPRARGDRVQAQ
jgi:hypothetical protein